MNIYPEGVYFGILLFNFLLAGIAHRLQMLMKFSLRVRSDCAIIIINSFAELELNLVMEGRSASLLGGRRYELIRDTLIWLFPAQDHILLDESPAARIWIGVFKPRLVTQISSTAILQERNPAGQFARRERASANALPRSG